MRPTTRHLPRVETLEGKALLSGLAAHLPASGHVVALAAPRRHGISLVGTIAGTFAPTINASPMSYAIGGTGAVSPLGATTAAGSVDVSRLLATGRIRAGTALANITLTGRDGTVNLRLTASSTIKSLTNAPLRLTYTVTGGTGTQATAKSTGRVDLTLTADAMSIIPQGTFTATFRGGR